MDDESFEQFDLGKDELGGDEQYIVDGLEGMQAMRRRPDRLDPAADDRGPRGHRV